MNYRTQTQPIFSFSQPYCTRSQPYFTHTQPILTHIKPYLTHSQPYFTRIQYYDHILLIFNLIYTCTTKYIDGLEGLEYIKHNTDCFSG